MLRPFACTAVEVDAGVEPKYCLGHGWHGCEPDEDLMKTEGSSGCASRCRFCCLQYILWLDEGSCGDVACTESYICQGTEDIVGCNQVIPSVMIPAWRMLVPRSLKCLEML